MNEKMKNEHEKILDEINRMLAEFSELTLINSETITKYINKFESGILVSQSNYEKYSGFLIAFKNELNKKLILFKANNIINNLRKLFEEKNFSPDNVKSAIDTVLVCFDKVNSIVLSKEDKKDIEVFVNLVDFAYSLLKHSIIINDENSINKIYEKIMGSELTSSILNSLICRDMANIQSLESVNAKSLLDIRCKIFSAEILKKNNYPLADLSLISDMVTLYSNDDMFELKLEFMNLASKIHLNNNDVDEIQKRMEDLETQLNEVINNETYYRVEGNINKFYTHASFAISSLVGIASGGGLYMISDVHDIFSKIASTIVGLIVALKSICIDNYGAIDLSMDQHIYINRLEEYKRSKEKLVAEINALKEEMNEKISDNNLNVASVNNMFDFLLDTLGHVNLEDKVTSLIEFVKDDVDFSKRLKYTAERINL